MNVKEIGMDQVRILPPKPGTCPECAVDHDPAMPHNRDSLFYQMRFRQFGICEHNGINQPNH